MSHSPPERRATRKLRAMRLLAALVLASVACVRPACAQEVPADSTAVRRVRFIDATAFGEDVLSSAIVTSPTSCMSVKPLCWFGVGVDREYLDERALGADLVRLRVLYYQRGYRSAAVSLDTTRTPSGMDVAFHIVEGEPVRVATVDVDSTAGLPPDLARDLTRDLPLEAGAPLSLVAYEATRDTLIARLANHGYASADALAAYTIPRDAPLTASVSYQLLPGQLARFGTIDVAGAEKVSPAVVRRMLTFHSGDIFNNEQVLRSQRNLFSQELFRHAEIHTSLHPGADTLVDVRVQVNEGELHRVRAGFGMSTADYLNIEGRWIHRSFLGGARRLELRARVSNLFAGQLGATPLFDDAQGIYREVSGTASADFTQPWFFDPLNTFGAGVYAERRTIPDVFVRTAKGGYVSFTRSVGASGSFTLGYRPELTKLESEEGDLVFCVAFDACGPDEIRTLGEPHWLSPVTITFVRDRSNSIFAPTSGYALRLEAERAGTATGSDFSYTRLLGEFTEYHAVGDGMVLAYRIRPGWARAAGDAEAALGVHPQKRFFAGGANSVRGFAQYHLGPKLLTIDAANLARPIDEGGAGCSAQAINAGSCNATALAREAPGLFDVKPVGGSVLLEGNLELRFPVYADKLRGAAFVDFGQVWRDRGSADLHSLVWTPGLGVRYFSAVGPIRVDIGFNGQGPERVQVVTTTVQYCPPAGAACEPIIDGVDYDPEYLRNVNILRPLNEVLWNPREGFLDRLQLHFSIGQAF